MAYNLQECEWVQKSLGSVKAEIIVKAFKNVESAVPLMVLKTILYLMGVILIMTKVNVQKLITIVNE